MTSNENVTNMADTLEGQLNQISTTENGEHFIGIEQGTAQLMVSPTWSIEDGEGSVSIQKRHARGPHDPQNWWIDITVHEALAMIEALTNSVRQLMVTPNLHDLLPEPTDDEVSSHVRTLTTAMDKAGVGTIGELADYCATHGTTPAELAEVDQ